MKTIKPSTLRITYHRLFIIVFLNLLLWDTIDLRLQEDLGVILQVLLGITSIAYLYYQKPFQKLNPFFVNTWFAFLLWPSKFILRTITFILIFLLIISPLFRETLDMKQESVRVYTPFQGFLAACCKVRFTETRFLIFEKNLGIISLHRTFESSKPEISRDNAHILFSYEEDEYDEKAKEYVPQLKTLRFDR